PVARHLAHAKVHLDEARGAEPGEHQHLVLPHLVLHDLERPRALERLVQALDDAVALHVVEQAVAPLALADLPGLEGFLQQLPVHRAPPALRPGSSALRTRAASLVSSRSSPSASSAVSRSTRSAKSWIAAVRSRASLSACRIRRMISSAERLPAPGGSAPPPPGAPARRGGG